MARLFVAASSQTLAAASTPVTGFPLTLAAWFRAASLPGTNQTLVSLDDGTSTNFFALRVKATTGTVIATCTPTGASETVGAVSIGTWAHCAAVFASATSRTAYLNGVAATADATNEATGAVTLARIGAIAAIQYADGVIGGVGVWNVALSAADILNLSNGAIPQNVQPQALVVCLPIFGLASPELDQVAGLSFTVNGPTLSAQIPPVPLTDLIGTRRQALLAPFANAYRRSAYMSTIPVAPAAPSAPNTPSPADTAQTLFSLLTWRAAGQAQADVYLDTVTPPVAIVATRYVGFAYAPTLLPNTTYYWKIVAWNAGGSTAGPVWSFTTPMATAVLTTLAGTLTTNVRYGSMSIHDVINAQPNTASFVIASATAPTVGTDVQIGLGSLDAASLLFGGTIQTVDESYVDVITGATIWPCRCIDYTYTLNRRRPLGVYVNVSATAVAQDLVARYAPGFTTVHVQGGLAQVTITFDGSADFMTCLAALAAAVAGFSDVDYSKDVYLFTALTAAAPDPLDGDHLPLNTPPITFSTDLSQVRTRVYGKGHAEVVPLDLAVSETIIPVASVANFNVAGGKVVAGTISGGAQSQVLTYSGVQLGGGGSLVGPGVQPSTAPVVTGAPGAGLPNGTYQYAYTDVTGAGESLPSPIGSATTKTVAAPNNYPTTTAFDDGTGYGANPPGDGLWAIGDYLEFQYTWALDLSLTYQTAPSGIAGTNTLVQEPGQLPGSMQNMRIQVNYSSDPAVKYVYVWVRRNGTSPWMLATGSTGITPNNPGQSSTYAYLFGGSIGASTMPAANAVLNKVNLTGIAIGPATVISRKVYRTMVGATQLKLLTTLADNTTTTLSNDVTADSALGANAPTSDTSGLTQPTGQVNAGAVSLLTAGAGPFSATGGWALAGSNVVRYTGITGNTLTGIPAARSGAILTTIPYGTPVLPAPALTGVNSNNGLFLAIASGSTVAVWVQRDDLPAQAAVKALELDKNGVPSDGIHEFLLVDGRRDEASLAALCDADLAIFSRPVVGVTYATRDTKTKSGKVVAISLALGPFDQEVFDPLVFDAGTPFGLTGNFTIQDVVITFDTKAWAPKYTVRATSVHFTLQDLLRRVVLATGQ